MYRNSGIFCDSLIYVNFAIPFSFALKKNYFNELEYLFLVYRYTCESRDKCKLDMPGLHKYFQRGPMPRSKETGLGEITNDVNHAVQRVLGEQNDDVMVNGGQTCKYTHFSPEDSVKIVKYATQCGNAAAVRLSMKLSMKLKTAGQKVILLKTD